MGILNLLKSSYRGKVGETIGQKWKDKNVVRSGGWERVSNSPAQIDALKGMGLIQRLFPNVVSEIYFLDFGKTKKYSERQNFVHNCKRFIKEWNTTGHGIERSENAIRLINADFDHNTPSSVFFRLTSSEPIIFTNGNPYLFHFYIYTEQGSLLATLLGSASTDMIELELDPVTPQPDWTQAFIGIVQIENSVFTPFFHCIQSIKLDPTNFIPATSVEIVSLTLDSVDATNVYYTITLNDQSYWSRVTGVNLRLQFLNYRSSVNKTLNSVITNGSVSVPLASIGSNYYLANIMYLRATLTNVTGQEEIDTTETIQTPPWEYFPPSSISITSLTWDRKDQYRSYFNLVLSDPTFFDNGNQCYSRSFISDASGNYFMVDEAIEEGFQYAFVIAGIEPTPDWSQTASFTVFYYTEEGCTPINARITIPAQPDWFTGGLPG